MNNFVSIEPGRKFVIDESMLTIRGRLEFRQYMPGKQFKYGIKLFKLADPSGFNYKIKVYEGH